jgi:regulator of replication initiation timing
MTDDPRAGLSDALSLTDPGAPLEALRHAIAWAARSLSTELDRDDADDVVALQRVSDLDRALADLGDLMSRVPTIVRIASPGPILKDRIAGHQSTLEQQRADLTADRMALDAVADLERQLKETETERERLQTRISMLDRQHQLASQLPALRARLEALQEVVPDATAEDAEHVAKGLVAAVHVLAELTAEQRELIGSELAKLIDDNASAAEALAEGRQRCDELNAEVDSRLTNAEQLQHEQQLSLPALELHRLADQNLTDGLGAAGVPLADSALESVRRQLAEIAARISELDGHLKPLLEEHTRAYAHARRIRNW